MNTIKKCFWANLYFTITNFDFSILLIKECRWPGSNWMSLDAEPKLTSLDPSLIPAPQRVEPQKIALCPFVLLISSFILFLQKISCQPKVMKGQEYQWRHFQYWCYERTLKMVVIIRVINIGRGRFSRLLNPFAQRIGRWY